MDSDAPIGTIGLGLIGMALSMRLIDAKIPLLGFDIDSTRCEALKANGGVLATAVHDLPDRCRAIVIAVYDAEQVDALFGEIEEEARRHGLQLPVTAAQADLLRTAIAVLGPDSDSSAVIEAIRRSAINEVTP
jgi:3-hydroxyisobutyrate dehydrogenase-like beta-hydroxyacid dehydrogenase